ncbi:glucose-6-phosphate isomerase [Maricaulis sp. D1M11]|uniref:glucose-6-phosphate isomerase n=1 Tax=Maricaulis sp. D1M11 TaxID=3076117 RepID=UPI0039B3C568
MSNADLLAHADRLKATNLRQLVDGDASRRDALVMSAAGLWLDASKQRLDSQSVSALLAAAKARGLSAAKADLLSGGIVNPTEGRPALHMAYRDGADIAGSEEAALVTRTQAETRAFAEAVRSGAYAPGGKPISRVVNIGIGGSDLGPRLVADALAMHQASGPDMRFVASLDPTDLELAVKGADPEATLFIVASKSFSTQETLMTALAARAWLTGHVGADRAGDFFAAASAAPDKAKAFGLDPERVFDFPDWVGGRYSVWSAVGLSLEIGLGPEVFAEFRAGARAMDQHFADAPPAENLPVMKGLIDVWNRMYLGYPSRCVAGYSARLAKLSDYFQQLEMESLGKSADLNGKPITHPSGALVWGGAGTEIQHSFFQWLHQGTDIVPVDFIGIRRHFSSDNDRERALAANMAAQGAALLEGREIDPADTAALPGHRDMPGGRPSSTLLLDDLTPANFGALISLFEHKVFVESLFYEVNPYDQWGVELGKVLTTGILSGEISGYDASTRALLGETGFQAE